MSCNFEHVRDMHAPLHSARTPCHWRCHTLVSFPHWETAWARCVSRAAGWCVWAPCSCRASSCTEWAGSAPSSGSDRRIFIRCIVTAATRRTHRWYLDAKVPTSGINRPSVEYTFIVWPQYESVAWNRPILISACFQSADACFSPVSHKIYAYKSLVAFTLSTTDPSSDVCTVEVYKWTSGAVLPIYGRDWSEIKSV